MTFFHDTVRCACVSDTSSLTSAVAPLTNWKEVHNDDTGQIEYVALDGEASCTLDNCAVGRDEVAAHVDRLSRVFESVQRKLLPVV